MTRARILLCDDHELFRVGLAALVDAQPDLQVVGQAADGLEALTRARDLRPDLIMMDIKMPVCDGLEATRLIRAEIPDARILILTVHDEDEKLFEAIKAGASGYLVKNANAADFLQAVRMVLAGEAAVQPKLAARLLNEFARLARAQSTDVALSDAADLTPREREVLNLIAQGATDKEIAAQLALSLHTVKSHVRSILSKLHAVNRRHAARLAAQGRVPRGKEQL
ncbi:MAG: response regulator transcription factor [Chloroflexi bacterium]|nr:response regulator transcription factor [Chloroflexota bacterium]